MLRFTRFLQMCLLSFTLALSACGERPTDGQKDLLLLLGLALFLGYPVYLVIMFTLGIVRWVRKQRQS